MTTSLEEILKRQHQRLPDISQYHYELTMPGSKIEDVNQRNARQEAVRQAHIGSWSRAIYQDKLRNDQGWANDAVKLINQINKVDDVLDKEADNRARDAFRKNYGETEEGHPWVEKDQLPNIDQSKVLEGQKELYEIDREINTKIFEGDPSDPEVLELKELGAYKKINRNVTEIAQLGFESSLAMYQDLSTQPIYNVQGFGKISFQYAQDKDLRFPDGSSVAEAIRQEIFSDIYVKLGLDKVPLRVLRKNYWGPLQQELTKLRSEEFRQKVKENDINYKLERNSSFLTSVIEDAGLAISGSPELKGSDGYLKLWDRGKGKAFSVQEIIKELKFAKDRGDTVRLQKALRAIVNGNYYSSQKGNKRISLGEWADIDGKNGDISILESYVSSELVRITGTSNHDTMEDGQKKFKQFYGTPLIKKFYELYPDGYIPDAKTRDKLIDEMLNEAYSNHDLPPIFKQPENLNLAHPLVAQLRAQMPLRPTVTDDQKIKYAMAGWNNEDKEIGLKNFNYWKNQIDDPGKRANLDVKIVPAQHHALYHEELEKAIAKDGSLDKIVEEYLKRHAEIDYGDVIADRVKADYKVLFAHELIHAEGITDVQDAAIRAHKAVEARLEPGKGIQSPYIGEQGKITPEMRDQVNKDIQAYDSLLNSTYKDNKLAILTAPPTETDIRVLTWMNNNPDKTHPLYRHIVQTTFPHMSPFDFQLRRKKFLIEREWTEWERKLYKESTGKDLNEEQFFKDKTHIQEINKVLNTLEKKWLIKEGIYNPEVDVLGFEVDLPNRDTGELIQKGKRLNENSSASEIANFVTEANGTNFMEPIFEMMYSKTALNGEGFNHITRKGIFQKKITAEKPLVDHTINEVNTLLNGNTSIDRLGVFGFTRREVNNILNQMNLSEEERATLKFDSKFQGRMMWEKIRFTVNGHNNLTTLNRKELPRLNRKEYKTFMTLLQNQQVTLADIEDEYMIWDTDAEIEQGTPSSQVLVYSPWHSPDIMHPAIAAYLESADYTELDLTKDHTKNKTAKESAIDQIKEADPNFSPARDRAIKAMNIKGNNK